MTNPSVKERQKSMKISETRQDGRQIVLDIIGDETLDRGEINRRLGSPDGRWWAGSTYSADLMYQMVTSGYLVSEAKPNSRRLLYRKPTPTTTEKKAIAPRPREVKNGWPKDTLEEVHEAMFAVMTDWMETQDIREAMGVESLQKVFKGLDLHHVIANAKRNGLIDFKATGRLKGGNPILCYRPMPKMVERTIKPPVLSSIDARYTIDTEKPSEAPVLTQMSVHYGMSDRVEQKSVAPDTNEGKIVTIGQSLNEMDLVEQALELADRRRNALADFKARLEEAVALADSADDMLSVARQFHLEAHTQLSDLRDRVGEAIRGNLTPESPAKESMDPTLFTRRWLWNGIAQQLHEKGFMEGDKAYTFVVESVKIEIQRGDFKVDPNIKLHHYTVDQLHRAAVPAAVRLEQDLARKYTGYQPTNFFTMFREAIAQKA